jgi:hypothetical protein
MKGVERERGLFPLANYSPFAQRVIKDNILAGFKVRF